VQGTTPQAATVQLLPAYWDSFTWDLFTWDGKSLGPSRIEMRGVGENVSLRIESNSDAFDQFTLNSAIIHYTPLKALKK
jgi:hypothetical protein